MYRINEGNNLDFNENQLLADRYTALKLIGGNIYDSTKYYDSSSSAIDKVNEILAPTRILTLEEKILNGYFS